MDTTITFKTDKTFRERLQAAAKAEGRTMSQQIRWMLECELLLKEAPNGPR